MSLGLSISLLLFFCSSIILSAIPDRGKLGYQGKDVLSKVSKVESNAGEKKTQKDKNVFHSILSGIVHLESQGTVAMFVVFL